MNGLDLRIKSVTMSATEFLFEMCMMHPSQQPNLNEGNQPAAIVKNTSSFRMQTTQNSSYKMPTTRSPSSIQQHWTLEFYLGKVKERTRYHNAFGCWLLSSFWLRCSRHDFIWYVIYVIELTVIFDDPGRLALLPKIPDAIFYRFWAVNVFDGCIKKLISQN